MFISILKVYDRQLFIGIQRYTPIFRVAGVATVTQDTLIL